MKASRDTSISIVKLLFILLSLAAISLAYSRANAGDSNEVAKFFKDSERQLEAKTQCYALKLALIDLITKGPNELKLKRYADYEGKAGQWTITELLQKHYVTTAHLNKTAFYEDYRKKAAKTVITKQIQALGGCASYAGPGAKDPSEIDFERLAEHPKDLGLSKPVNSGR